MRRANSAAIRGVAHRGGGQHLEGRGPHGADDGGVAAQHRLRLVHRRRIQPAGPGHAFRQAQHGLFIENLHRVARVALIDDEAHRIGAEVDDRPPYGLIRDAETSVFLGQLVH